MGVGEPKQHVPVFVGSTFEDLKDYRRSVRDALTQLETIVRGMEYFGSKPGSPIKGVRLFCNRRFACVACDHSTAWARYDQLLFRLRD